MTLSEQLDKAIRDSRLSLYAVAKGAGVDYATLYRFMTADRDMRLSTASAVCEFLGLRLTRPGRVEAPPDRRRRGVK